tara:strand:- start:720 stop:1247 length:528 start_codon:yes stop_codon:yes gene_type:complete
MMSLSDKSYSYMKSCHGHNVKTQRPAWTDYFLSIASLVSLRSSDSQTKHGCVITDNKNRILGVGYNSFPSGMPDELLPNIRPHKYKWMVHAERNALANCTIRPESGIAYITGRPCIDCVKSLYQEGVRNLVCIDGHGTHLEDSEDECVLEIIQNYGGLKIDWVKPDLKNVFKELI